MQDSILSRTLWLLKSADSGLWEVVGLSLRVSGTAVLISCAFGFILGGVLATTRFRGRSAIHIFLNASMSMPPVVVGLIVYMLLSRSGPLGWLGLLYTPTAMIIAQTLLITPLIAALSRQIIEDLFNEYAEQFASMRLSFFKKIRATLWDARFSLLTVALAGLGRSLSEVGAVIIVGGNIEHLTRVMTTAIALETSKGDLPMALALGAILLTIALLINTLLSMLNLSARRFAYA